MRIDFADSGKKTEVLAAAKRELKGKTFNVVDSIVVNAPGTHISLQIIQTEAEDGKSGRLIVAGNFWSL